MNNEITYIIYVENINLSEQILQDINEEYINNCIITDKLSVDIQTEIFKLIIFNENDNINDCINNAEIHYSNYNILKDKICIITLCYNEVKILPFAINYWNRFANHIIVYDNGSTDGSIELLQQYNDIELKYFRYKEDNKINDKELREFKNNIWKEYKDIYDWIIICDVDEFLYIKNVEEFLNYINSNDIALIKPKGYQLISTYFPSNDIPCLLHNEVKYAVRDKMFDKCVMINTHKVKDINFDYGCHQCNPKIIDGAIYQKNDIYLFHAKWLTWQYVDEKYKSVQSKLSEFNVERGFGIEYRNNEEIIKKTYIELINNCEFISDWYNDKYAKIDDNILNNIQKVNPNNNRLCIYVQIYKEKLTESELESLIQLFNIINNKYDIILSYPENLNIKYYQKIIDNIKYKNIHFINLPKVYYQSIETYNQLCLTYKFYDIFNNYDYMLIYQLDSIIYYDNLEYFMSLNYDFIGAPHNAPYYICGNGGFSLRKVQSMINILRNTDIDYTIYEDIFINSKIINKTPINICRMFALSWPKEDEFSTYIYQPMGEHYFGYNK